MFSVCIIDNNHFHSLYLEENIERILKTKDVPYEINSVKNIADFYKNIQQTEIVQNNTIFIIDIHLNNRISGIEIAQKIREKNSYCFIIFCTADDSKIYETMQRHISSSGYLIKKNHSIQSIEGSLNEMFLFIEKVLTDRMKTEYTIQNTEKTLKITWGANLYSIPLDNIIYIESIPLTKNKTKIVTYDNEYIITQPIHQLKQQINEKHICIELKSFIINLNWILAIRRTAKEIELKNGKILYVGTRIIDKLRKSFQEYLTSNTHEVQK